MVQRDLRKRKLSGRVRPFARALAWGWALVVIGFGCDAMKAPGDPSTLPETILDSPSGDDSNLTPSSVDAAPITVSFVTTALFCCNPLTVEFTAQPSDPMFGRRAKYRWDFGDGRTGEGQTAQHTYSWPGEYPVSLTATALDGRIVDTHRRLKLSVDGSGRLDTQVSPVDAGGEVVDSVPSIEPLPETVVADAGSNQRVVAGERVTLFGRYWPADDFEVVEVRWEQIAGTPVIAGPIEDARLSFLAPSSPDGPQTLRFRFIVTAESFTASDEVQVAIFAVDEAPNGNVAPTVIADASAEVFDQPVLLTLSGADADGDDLTFSIIVPPARGRLGTVDNSGFSTATVLYTPPSDFLGTELFLFRADDGQLPSAAARFTVQIVGRQADLHVEDTTYLTPMNRPVELTLTTDDTTGPAVQFSIVGGPRRGTLGPIRPISAKTAKVLYLPPAGFKGSDAFEVQAVGDTTESNVATVAVLVQPLMIPWLEVNSPDSDASALYRREEGALPGMTQLDFCLLGLESWGQVTDTIIVTTRIEDVEDLYIPLMARKPAHVRVIGGVKTFGVPGASPGDNRPYNFADAAEWRRITHALEQTAAITGSDIVVLENETALRRFTRGDSPVAIDGLANALAPLAETGLTTWSWVPWIQEDIPAFPNRQAVSSELVRAVSEALPQNIFMTDYVSWQGWQNSPRKVQLRQLMDDLVSPQRTQDGLFVTTTGFMDPNGEPVRCYTPAEALAQMQVLRGEHLRLYPGGGNWVLVGREFARLLPPLADTLLP